MKTILCTLVGTPHVGDDLRICASAKGGGRTDAPYIVTESDFWRDPRPDEDLSGLTTMPVSSIGPDGNCVLGVRVKLSPAETLARIAKGLEASFAKQFSSELATAKAKRSMVYIACSALTDDWRLYYGTAGDNKGNTRIEIVDLMADDDDYAQPRELLDQ